MQVSLPGLRVLAHAQVVDASENCALDALVVVQIALDGLAQELRARDPLLPDRQVHLFKHQVLKNHSLMASIWSSRSMPAKSGGCGLGPILKLTT
jgi:hypothetical protein